GLVGGHVVYDLAWIAQRHDVVRPIRGQVLDALDHRRGVEVGPRIHAAGLALAGDQHFDVGSAGIHGEDLHTRHRIAWLCPSLEIYISKSGGRRPAPSRWSPPMTVRPTPCSD